MEWKRLEDTPLLLKQAYQASKQLTRASKEELTVNSLPFGYPEVKSVYTTMKFLRQWFQTAGVEIYFKGIEHLQKEAGYRNIILPNHPNLFDSLATRYLFYCSGQFVPFTAAVDTLSRIPLLAKVFKTNGTFFINTKNFSDLKYREQVNTFMRQVADHNEWLQFYIEGDRSSHERQRVPRRGLLKAMCDQPCRFVPVSISYEKILSSYIHSVGRVYIEIHPPIYYHPGDDFSSLVSNVTGTLLKGVNAYTTDVIATLLLQKGQKELPMTELEKKAQWLEAILVSREVPFVEVELTKACHFLGLKFSKDNVIIPSVGTSEHQRLLHHRERILHTLYDLADPPDIISKEFAWTPPSAPLIFDEELRTIASHAITPLIQLYTQIISLLDKGVTQTQVLEQKLISSTINKEMVRNTMRLLQDQKVLSVSPDGIITLN